MGCLEPNYLGCVALGNILNYPLSTVGWSGQVCPYSTHYGCVTQQKTREGVQGEPGSDTFTAVLQGKEVHCRQASVPAGDVFQGHSEWVLWAPDSSLQHSPAGGKQRETLVRSRSTLREGPVLHCLQVLLLPAHQEVAP